MIDKEYGFTGRGGTRRIRNTVCTRLEKDRERDTKVPKTDGTQGGYPLKLGGKRAGNTATQQRPGFLFFTARRRKASSTS